MPVAFADELELMLTVDYVENQHGGLREESAVLHNIDLIYSASSADFGGTGKGDFYLYVLSNGGDDPSEFIGDTQVTSNIETTDTTKLYEAWYRQHLRDDLSVLFGLHDYNSVFATVDNAGLLLNSSFGIGPDIAQVGPSIFSTTALGLVLSYETATNYVYLAAYDGVPGDPENDHGTQLHIDSGDGIFSALEWGLFDDNRYRLSFGFWHLSAQSEAEASAQRSTSQYGSYALAQTQLGALATFIQAGQAKPQNNTIGAYLGAGFTWPQAFGEFGFGLASARASRDYRRQRGDIAAHETTLEISCRFDIGEYLSIQPDFQYVMNPSFEPGIDDAVVTSLRIYLSNEFSL